MRSAGGRAAGVGPADHPASEEEEAMGGGGGLTLLAHALADTAALLGVRMAPFACGPVAMALGRYPYCWERFEDAPCLLCCLQIHPMVCLVVSA